MFVEVAPYLPGHDRTYHYCLPADWPDNLPVQAGHLVVVPFGAQKLQGIVVAITDDEDDLPPDLPELKPIEALVDPEPVLTRWQLDLAYWLAQYYQTPLPACLVLMLPPGLSKRGDTRYTLIEREFEGKTDAQTAVIAALDEGPLRRRQLERRLKKSHPGWQNTVNGLVAAGVLQRTPVLEMPNLAPKQVRNVRLTLPLSALSAARLLLDKSKQDQRLLRLLLAVWPAELLADDALRLLPRTSETAISTLEKGGWVQRSDDGRLQLARSYAETALELQAQMAAPSKKAAILDFLAHHAGSAVEVSWVYAETGANLSDLNGLAEREWVVLGEHEIIRDSLRELDYVPTQAPTLTPEQQAVWQQVQPAFAHPPQTFLLHGVTGSGKTEIYLRAVAEVLAHGQQAIVLVPEIALTPQTVERFLARFPGRVAIWHSQLSEGERYDTWRRARAGYVDVVVGARSALFLPLPRLGIIVLDEEHDESYKQTLNDDYDGRPYYHARETAAEYAQRIGAICLLGSATPALVSYRRAQRGEYHLLEMPHRIMAHRRKVVAQTTRWQSPTVYKPVDESTPEALYLPMPTVRVVDMRQELRAGNRSIFSRALQAQLTQVLENGEQAILFLNRRGLATYVFCRDCGYTATCNNCDTPLTYHGEAKTLVCHRCGTRERPPETCPQCGSQRIRYFGLGTERIETEVTEQFPAARTLRWDFDTTRGPNAHAIILRHFANHQADVLIGTQMVAKGLDLPLVTLVGVISADTGLVLPDYRAAERTFQLLAQVAGRAGRGLRGGQVIIQSFMPDHYAIEAASQHNYAQFYAEEMRYRRDQGFPPYTRLARLVYRNRNAQKAEVEARHVAAKLRNILDEQQANSTFVIGPAPCFFDRVAGEFRWHIVLRGPNPAPFLRHLSLPPGWQTEIDPLSLL